ncbi:hypothetical protein CLIB1423_01S11012 [[Candida] railenensis]|uniref:Uncharacterized protein n=1 Tax=[Candida] railenensis TaxID=45579 RepID=A0A9P0QJV9_9ASCO|nr:hypothetical protein CLIB1423_01S11012 [[Candida] railenensis]
MLLEDDAVSYVSPVIPHTNKKLSEPISELELFYTREGADPEQPNLSRPMFVKKQKNIRTLVLRNENHIVNSSHLKKHMSTTLSIPSSERVLSEVLSSSIFLSTENKTSTMSTRPISKESNSSPDSTVLENLTFSPDTHRPTVRDVHTIESTHEYQLEPDLWGETNSISSTSSFVAFQQKFKEKYRSCLSKGKSLRHHNNLHVSFRSPLRSPRSSDDFMGIHINVRAQPLEGHHSNSHGFKKIRDVFVKRV